MSTLFDENHGAYSDCAECADPKMQLNCTICDSEVCADHAGEYSDDGYFVCYGCAESNPSLRSGAAAAAAAQQRSLHARFAAHLGAKYVAIRNLGTGNN